MRPSETTAIWSAWAMVDSRWAITMVVRPARRRWRASVMRASLGASRLLVALVRNQQGRVGDPGPGEGDQLALPGGQEGAALADLGVVAVGQAGDDLVGPDRPGGRLDLGPGRLGATEADVVQHHAREQEAALVHRAALAGRGVLAGSRLPLPHPAVDTSTSPGGAAGTGNTSKADHAE